MQKGEEGVKIACKGPIFGNFWGLLKNGSLFCLNVHNLGKRVLLDTEEVSVFRKGSLFGSLAHFESSRVISTM